MTTETKKTPAKKPATMYGVMIDLTGVTAAPKKLKKHPAGYGFFDGTIHRKAGELWHGDGRDYRVTFCDPDLKQVKLWLKGAGAQAKLFRASVTKGK